MSLFDEQIPIELFEEIERVEQMEQDPAVLKEKPKTVLQRRSAFTSKRSLSTLQKKTKSYHDLPSAGHGKYDHIESRVKQYIKEIDDQNGGGRSRKHSLKRYKSMPETFQSPDDINVDDNHETIENSKISELEKKIEKLETRNLQLQKYNEIAERNYQKVLLENDVLDKKVEMIRHLKQIKAPITFEQTTQTDDILPPENLLLAQSLEITSNEQMESPSIRYRAGSSTAVKRKHSFQNLIVLNGVTGDTCEDDDMEIVFDKMNRAGHTLLEERKKQKKRKLKGKGLFSFIKKCFCCRHLYDFQDAKYMATHDEYDETILIDDSAYVSHE